jgi:hypothetical protein
MTIAVRSAPPPSDTARVSVDSSAKISAAIGTAP